MIRTDVVVLGGGIVGVAAALHLQQRGRSVVLVDRAGVAAETSYGNAGLIQREGVVPYPFPRDPLLMARYAFNLLPDANVHWSALPKLAPWLFRYWRASTPERMAATARAMRPLIERCVSEHEVLMRDAGIAALARHTGYLRVYRSPQALDAAILKDRRDREAYGVNFEPVDAGRLAELEPHLRGSLAGGILMPDPVSVADPAAVVRAYAALLEARGGRIVTGDARTLRGEAAGWQVETGAGPVTGAAAVVALGPWSDDIFRPLGYAIPLGIKRGYHLHFRPEGNATLQRPVLDAQNGYVLAPMSAGIRLTTGVEFAERDAPPSPAHLRRVEPRAREIFPLGTPVETAPWLGRRPCLPDMLPMIGRAPRHDGLWFDFGHHHLGFTLGPVTGRLLAEMMTGQTPFTDPAPYRADRFM
ncbi:MAG TPA: FAD-dependent oxidoreductase [Hyphomicrobiaceae bacterium]|jgi:D-amino-acid dehydrogenase|nr:FAD-dependent oxidoreductase [Hyphomicrobiaceae bacterium]